MSSHVYAIIQKDGKEVKHIFETPRRGFQDFSCLPYLVRRAHGRDVVIESIGIASNATLKGWEPPAHWPIVSVKMAKNKFAFGRKFKPKDNDFDKEVQKDDAEVGEVLDAQSS